MKVVLFCGGMGMRLREHAEALPKPIVPVGHRPIIWHVMKYYAHFGQKDFILCLGYKSAVIKEYFLRYNEAISNDFVMSEGGQTSAAARHRHPGLDDHLCRDRPELEHRPAAEGGRTLRARRRSVSGQLRRRTHRLSAALDDRPLHGRAARWRRSSACSRPRAFTWSRWARGTGHRHPAPVPLRALRQRRLLHLPKRDLQLHPRRRRARRRAVPPAGRGRLLAGYRHDGFWLPMDTFKDKQLLEDMYSRGVAPWEVWKNGAASQPLPQKTMSSRVGSAATGRSGSL